MKIRQVMIPIVLIATVLVLFAPGTAFAPRPAAAGSGPVSPLVPPTSCDLAQFVTDVTIPDGTTLTPGAFFSKTWRIQNISNCTWTTSYSMVFVYGAQMGAPASVNFPTSVDPGGTVDLSVNMTAPTAPGHYIGYWKLRDDVGIVFGLGPWLRNTFFVNIYVGWRGIRYYYWPYGQMPTGNYWMYTPQGYFNGRYWLPLSTTYLPWPGLYPIPYQP
jgi:hypothetical protein